MWNVTEFWECQFTFSHYKLYVLFHFQSIFYIAVKLHVMSDTVFPVEELTVNQLIGFYCSIFTVFYC